MSDIYDNPVGPASALTGPNNAFQGAGGPQFFNQIPQQRAPILLWQGPIVKATWTKLIDVPRNPYSQIQDIWVGLQSGTTMDCYFAIAGSLSTFDASSGTPLVQEDVFQLCSNAGKIYRESNAYIALNPKQVLWFYSTEACNLRISGTQVDL